ncbi:YxeA family protein [Bacillus gaemokensis]|uniref:YxeA family protein n=1 Tax=Bacillus gaemokensis TaxID=574375 RepID=UPI0006925140|nr:YxeA family protein [Bacillus gaemokensis]KYG37489.1 hypothetical protein AZF08_23765 [Bacillus gaemokensis]
MKKLIGIVVIFFVGIIAWGIADKEDSFGIKSWMTSEYYVQINGDGKEATAVADDGTKDKFNWYTLKAYNAYGDEKTIYFHGMKKLRVNAYLRVEIGGKYNGESYYGIHRYEEVRPEDMPKKAKEKLDKKQ